MPDMVSDNLFVAEASITVVTKTNIEAAVAIVTSRGYSVMHK
jgi:hypothetical protein